MKWLRLIVILVLLAGVGYWVYRNYFPHYNLTAVPLAEDMQQGRYVQIPGTQLEIKVPGSYHQRKNINDGFLDVTPELTFTTDIFQQSRDVLDCQNKMYLIPARKADVEPYVNDMYCKLLFKTGARIRDPHTEYVPNVNIFSIDRVITDKTPQDWLLDTFAPQGQNLREHLDTAPKIKQITLSGMVFYAVTIGCCAGAEDLYMYPYEENGTKMLVIFVNMDVLPNMLIPDPFLDTVLATLKKK